MKVAEIGGPMGVSVLMLYLFYKSLKKQQERDHEILNEVRIATQVMQGKISVALNLAEDVKDHDRKLVRHEEKIKKNREDVQNQWSRIKDTEVGFQKLKNEFSSKH